MLDGVVRSEGGAFLWVHFSALFWGLGTCKVVQWRLGYSRGGGGNCGLGKIEVVGYASLFIR